MRLDLVPGLLMPWVRRAERVERIRMMLETVLDLRSLLMPAHEEERTSKLAASTLYEDGTLDDAVPGAF